MTFILLFLIESILVLALLLPFKPASSVIKSYIIGFLVSLAWFFLMVQTPQIQDIQIDAIKYESQALAITKHWQGIEVASQQHYLNGLVARGLPTWKVESDLPLIAVLGTQHILYPSLLALGYTFSLDTSMVVMFNIPLMAACFSLVFLLGREMFNLKGIFVFVPCVLLAFDSAFFALGSVLLRDIIIIFLVLLLFLYVTAFWKTTHKRYLWGVVLCVALFMGIRYHFSVLFLFVLAFFALFLFLLPNKKDKRSTRAIHIFQKRIVQLGFAVFFGILLGDMALQGWGMISSSFNHAFVNTQLVLGSSSVAAGPSESYTTVKPSLIEGKPSLIEGILHTLFAPYPWVIVYPGLTGNSFYELFFLGSFIFIVTLPYLWTGIQKSLQNQSVLQMILLGFILAVGAAYFVTFGEFSTRQRESMMPFFWVFVAAGVQATWEKSRRGV